MGDSITVNLLVGLDGCTENAWVVAESDPALTAIRFSIATDLTHIFQRADRNELVAVLDVPIGLIHAERACDRDARRVLKERRSSVFTPPCREALSASTYDEAKIINRRQCGKAISQQAFNIRERIRAVDAIINPRLQARIRESHPEVAFAVLNGNRPLMHSKNTPDGVAERVALLTAAGMPPFEPVVERSRLGLEKLAVDDVVDAAVMLLTARDVALGRARRLPSNGGSTDERQLVMEMWMPANEATGVTQSKSGVRLYDDFRDNLIIERYHPDLASMRGSKRERLRSENSEDALTWNVFKSLGQVDPSFWLPRLRAKAFPQAKPTPLPRIVTTHLWKLIEPPPALRLVQKDEGASEIDVVIETEFSVWFIEVKFKSDISTGTTNNPTRDQIIRNIDVGSWYAGQRDFDFALLIVDEERSRKGVEVLRTLNTALPTLPHRPDGMPNVRGRGLLLWKDVRDVLGECATAKLRDDERQIAARAVSWMQHRRVC